MVVIELVDWSFVTGFVTGPEYPESLHIEVKPGEVIEFLKFLLKIVWLSNMAAVDFRPPSTPPGLHS